MPRNVRKIASGMHFRRMPFMRLVRQIAQELGEPDVRISSTAMLDVQEITEQYFTVLMRRCRIAMVHAHRETLYPSDIDAVYAIAYHKGPVPEWPCRAKPLVKKTTDGPVKTQKVYTGNEKKAISVPAIQRAANKAFVLRISELAYERCTSTVKAFLTDLMTDCIACAKSNKRHTIKADDVDEASGAFHSYFGPAAL